MGKNLFTWLRSLYPSERKRSKCIKIFTRSTIRLKSTLPNKPYENTKEGEALPQDLSMPSWPWSCIFM